MRDETKRDDGWWVICLVVADDEGLFSVNNHPGYRSAACSFGWWLMAGAGLL
jgi:hypothetical protein